MPTKQKNTRQQKKGLSDQELAEKYEAGKTDMDKAINEMLQKPSKAAVKTEKQTRKKL